MAIIRNTPSALAAKLSSQRFLSCYFILDRCGCFNSVVQTTLSILIMFFFTLYAALLQGYLAMHWKIHHPNLLLSILYLFASRCWIPKDLPRLFQFIT